MYSASVRHPFLHRQCANSWRFKLAGDNMSDDPNLRDEDALAGEEAALETAGAGAEAQGARRAQRRCRSCPLCIQHASKGWSWGVATRK